jgi:hypothetical protein
MTFESILEEMLKIHKEKNADYSAEGLFGNFQESQRIGIPDYKGAFVRLQDKYSRCCNLIKGQQAQVVDESLEDTLIDLANYSIIVLYLLRQHKQNVKDEYIPLINYQDK